ncbi:MAG: T9SS type A sorting domain-containing protein [bacterium]
MFKQLLMGILILLYSVSSLSAGWERTYGSQCADDGYSVDQTTDGGYIITGSWETGPWEDVYLVKTDGNGNVIWENVIGTDTMEAGYSVQQTTDNGYIVSGYTSAFGYLDQIYLIKTTSGGDTSWTKYYGGSGPEFGYSIQQTVDGGYIVAGLTGSFGAGGNDVFLIKTDSLGDSIWAKTFGGSYYDQGSSIQQTTDGGYIITGRTESYGAGSSDVYLIKTDSIGDTLWTRTFGGSGWDFGKSVHQTTDGGYIIVGTWSYDYHTGIGDVFLIKTDANGDTVWTRIYGGSNLERGTSLDQTTDGGYIITGRTESYGAGEADVYLIKTDSLGNILWTRTFGGSEDDWGNSVQQTVDGGYIIAGTTYSFGTGYSSVYLIKTDSIGLNVEETILSSPENFSYSINYLENKNISFQISVTQNSELTLNIYDCAGRWVSTPISGYYSAGIHSIDFQVENSGIYFIKLKIDNQIERGKFIVF